MSVAPCDQNRAMPGEWWQSLSRENTLTSFTAHFPACTTASHHHISPSRTGLTHTTHVFIFCQAERTEECVQHNILNNLPQSAGVLHNNTKCLWVLLAKLSFGDTLWNDSSGVKWLAPCLPLNCGGSGGDRKTDCRCFVFTSALMDTSVFCGILLFVWFNLKSRNLGTNLIWKNKCLVLFHLYVQIKVLILLLTVVYCFGTCFLISTDSCHSR